MTKEFLEECLAKGLSLDRIAALVDRHPSTVGYHLRKHGLRAVNHELNSPRGSRIEKKRLQEQLGQGASLREIAQDLSLSISTVRYWLKKHGLSASGTNRRRSASAAARDAGQNRLERKCPRHGPTTFVLESRGYYRCLRCRSEAVSERRRRAKRQLVLEAGGRCAICGYDAYQGALQFHHVDPGAKELVVSRTVTRSIKEMRAEARKCVLLCANCHAEVEAGVTSAPPQQASLQ